MSGTISPLRPPSMGIVGLSPDEARPLPPQLTMFVGREREIAAVTELLMSSRLLTLTGAGGAGKTRLALQVASKAEHDFVRVAWVDLAPVAEPRLLPEVVAAALGFREAAGRSAHDTLVERIRGDSVLVLLDNCEHLVDACASLADRLLRDCPRIRVLATSREALGVQGEQAWLVPALSLPPDSATTAESVLRSEAGRLFQARARAVLRTFAIEDRNAASVARICRRLDGIPLAIELAAARVRVLAPEQIADRLDDAFRLLSAPGRPAIQRHRTLRESIDWSHALLDEAEASLFRRLAVFSGSFSLDAVEAVCCAPPLVTDEVLDLLSALVEKSMVVLESAEEEARYRLLETLRQYARQRLADAGEEATMRDRHAAYFVHLTAVAERPMFGGTGRGGWTGRLIADEANLRAAADWLEQSEDGAEAALQLAARLHWHWFARGQFREGERQLSAALTRADRASAATCAKAYTAAAMMAFWTGDHERVATCAQKAVSLLREADDAWSLAYALSVLGIGLSWRDADEARLRLDEAVSTARGQGRTVLLAFALYWQGRVALTLGELAAARRCFEECRDLGLELGNQPAVAHPLTMLGLVEVRSGDLAEAGAQLSEALRLHLENADVLGCVWSLEGLARLAHRKLMPERATRLLAAAVAERNRTGSAWSERERMDADAMRALLRRELGEDAFQAIWTDASAGPLSDAARLELEAHRLVTVGRDNIASRMVDARVAAASSQLSLRVRALGELRIDLDGHPLPRTAWSSSRARELLLVLLCHPQGRTREQVGVVLWPEASSEQVRNNFHVTLHRLRNILGSPALVRLEDDRYRIAPDAVEFDAARFERELPPALKRLKTVGDVEGLEVVLAHYGGDFLEHEKAVDWHFELRERLRSMYLDALRSLADWWFGQGRWAEASEALRRLIARDKLHEAAYRQLMICQARLGERSEALRLWQRLKELLEQELDAEPEAETADLYLRLKGSQAI